MRFQVSLLALIAALAPAAFADVEFVTPAAGGNLGAGSVQITWKDSGATPAISALTTYTLQLMVGGNTDDTSLPLLTLVAAAPFSTGNTYTANIAAGVAGPTPNGFYLKMTSVAAAGGIVYNFSDRFNMPSLTGTTPPTYVQAAQALNGATAGRATVNQVNAGNAAGAAGGGAANGDQVSLPYESQTGLTKYAPMQPVPPTKITANSYTPLHPTSAYSVATTWVPHPSIVTTVTASQTFSVSSMENTASPQSMPTGDMAKFMARWLD